MADLASTRVFGKLTVMHDAIVRANAEIVGNVTAAGFVGDGSLITALKAEALASGPVPDARLPLAATRWPSWGEVTDKPLEFAPSAHAHVWADLSDPPAEATRWPAWTEVTAKPTTFTPSAHGHDVAEITGLSDAATTTVATIRSGTTKANVGLPNVRDVALNWSWGTATPTHIWGSQGDSTHSYVYNATDLKNFLGLTKSDVGLGSVRNVASHSQTEADGRFVRADTGSTINVGRGNVFIENNTGDNQDGAGITVRTQVNPAGGDEGVVGSIFSVRSSGQAVRLWVGQSKTTVGSNSFEAGGDITAYSSDARLKENVKEIQDPLGKLAQLRGVTYDWIAECEALGFRPSNPHEHGVIAQEVQQVIPDAVAPAPFNRDYLTVKYERLVPLLIEAIKEERSKREALEERLDRFVKIMEK